jgi:hypothetical protein
MGKEKFLKQNATPTDNKNGFDPAVFEKYRIDPLAELIEPPVILAVNNSPIAMLGDISLWIGKAKSMKTFLITCAAAAAVSSRCSIDSIMGIVRPSANKVLYFDTEQSPYYAQKTIKRICRQIGINAPENLIAYGLRPLTPLERYEFIEFKIYNTPGLAFVVIDGIVDLLSHGINDEEEAIGLTSALLRWTEEKNIHIATVLHQNKGDFNPRGHIGTYLQNKAGSVISVTKSEKDSKISIVKPLYCRDKDFQEFAFTINEDGLPVLADMPAPETSRMLKIKKLMEMILPPPKAMTHGCLLLEYQQHAAVKERAACNAINDAVTNEILRKDEVTGSYTLYHSLKQDDKETIN